MPTATLPGQHARNSNSGDPSGWIALFGRLLMAAIFVISGAEKLAGFSGTAAMIAGRGLPLPEVATVIAIVVELGGGLLLVLGWKTRWVAWALALFTLVAGAIFHNFWAAPPDQVQNQTIHFMKNLSMAGGLLYIAAFGAGALSLDARG